MDKITFYGMFNMKRLAVYCLVFVLLCIPVGFVYGKQYRGYRGDFREYTHGTEELYVVKMEEYRPDPGIAEALIEMTSPKGGDPFFYVNNGAVGANYMEKRFGEYARYRIEYGEIRHMSPEDVGKVNKALKAKNVTLGRSIDDIAWAPAEFALTNVLGMEDRFDPIQAGYIWAVKLSGEWKMITLAKSPVWLIGE